MERRWLPVCFLLMQAAWTAAVAEVASARFGGQGLLLTLPIAAATLFAGYATGRRLLRRDEEETSRVVPYVSLGLGIAWSVGTVWLGRHTGQDLAWLEALPAAVGGVWSAPLADALALAAVFALWWHGQRTGQSPPEHDSTVRAFGIGALAFAAALLWAAGLRPALVALPPSVLLYLAAGLPALSLARLKEVRRDLQTNVARGEPAHLDAAWWRTLAPPVAVVLGSGLLAALLLSDTTWRGAILAALSAAGEAVVAVLYLPILAIGLVAEWLVYLLRRLRRPPGEQEAPPAAPGGAAELLRQLQREYEAPLYLDTLRWVALALGGVLVLLAFLASSRAVRRVRERDAAHGLSRESLSTWQLLLADVRAFWRGLLRRLRNQARALNAALPRPGRGDAAGDAAARDAREAYRELLSLGRENALPRRPHETPDEYLDAWTGALPATAEASALTASYKRTRYGPPTSPRAPVSELRSLIARIRSALLERRTRA